MALTACSSGGSVRPTGVSVPPVNGLPFTTLTACRTLSGLLPDQLAAGVERRGTTPASYTASAYGDPAITVRCGVPAGNERDASFVFNDVAWSVREGRGSRTWTTLGRPVNVEVVVPDSYPSQAELVGTIALAVKKAA